MRMFKLIILFIILSSINVINANETNSSDKKKKIIYLNTNIEIPFWKIMSNGIQDVTKESNYSFEVYSAENSAKKELELTIKAVKEKVSGIIVSPSNSSACVTILEIAKNANIPVVISDIGTDAGEYISYISSNNKLGAYNVGKILVKQMLEKNWENGKVGIVAIPQKRLNGQERTAGFLKALNEHNIKGVGIKQLKLWTEEETYQHTKEFIQDFPDLRAIWLQTSNLYASALKAIRDMNKENEILLIAFDAEPEFLELIPKGTIIGSGMQQPYLMGQVAAQTLIKYLKGQKVEKNIQIPILTISTENINSKLPLINKNVLGIK